MDTVELSPDRVKALKYYSPLLVFTLVIFLYVICLEFVYITECAYFFKLNLSVVALVVICYVLPVYFFLWSMWAGVIGYKSLKSNYFPPLDIPVFFRATARKGNLSTVKGVVTLFSPVLGIWLLYIGHTAFMETSKDKSVFEAFEYMDSICSQSHNNTLVRDSQQKTLLTPQLGR
ncbi:MAG: hypothetical protein OEY06_12210 [Gammaproteobacteria bacterium]|nr:hypothetical protein [Gammaproteobacteria bacterium]